MISLETLTPAFLMPKLEFLLVQPLSRLLHGKALWSWNDVSLRTWVGKIETLQDFCM